jgi:Flp pilus assembly pilin Flp
MRDFLDGALGRLRRDRRGVTALEYGILTALIVVALVSFFADPVSGFLPVFFDGVVSTTRDAAGF